jgi:hypothetical protein
LLEDFIFAGRRRCFLFRVLRFLSAEPVGLATASTLSARGAIVGGVIGAIVALGARGNAIAGFGFGSGLGTFLK